VCLTSSLLHDPHQDSMLPAFNEKRVPYDRVLREAGIHACVGALHCVHYSARLYLYVHVYMRLLAEGEAVR
jgi:hypothetical protein